MLKISVCLKNKLNFFLDSRICAVIHRNPEKNSLRRDVVMLIAVAFYISFCFSLDLTFDPVINNIIIININFQMFLIALLLW